MASRRKNLKEGLDERGLYSACGIDIGWGGFSGRRFYAVLKT
jgi:hypothetical protein